MSGTYRLSFTVQSYAKEFNKLTYRTQSLGVYPILKIKLTGDW